MARNKEIQDLLAQYMEACGETERWITVYEFRTYFHLDESTAHSISGFLRYKPFFSCQYRVKKIEKIIVHAPERRRINRYLVKKRPEIKEAHAGSLALATAPGGLQATKLRETVDHELFTDHDAVEIFNKVLCKQTRGRLT